MLYVNQEYITKVPTTNRGLQEVKVKFPTDAQWLEYFRGRKVIEKSLGRKQSENILVGAEAAAEKLFSAIQVSGDIDQAGMELVVRRLATVSVQNVEADAGSYTVHLMSFVGTAVHTVRMPSAAHLRRVDQATRVIDLPYGAAEIRVNLEIFAEIYAEIGQPLTGYGEGMQVPITHKHAVVQAAVTELRNDMEGGEENFL